MGPALVVVGSAGLVIVPEVVGLSSTVVIVGPADDDPADVEIPDVLVAGTAVFDVDPVLFVVGPVVFVVVPVVVVFGSLVIVGPADFFVGPEVFVLG